MNAHINEVVEKRPELLGLLRVEGTLTDYISKHLLHTEALWTVTVQMKVLIFNVSKKHSEVNNNEDN